MFEVGKLWYPGQQQIHAFGKMPDFFHLENYGYHFKCLIGWQRDDHDCVQERYNSIKLNDFICWLFSGAGGGGLVFIIYTVLS